MIIIDNTVSPGVVVMLDCEDKNVEELIEKYQLATRKRYDIRLYGDSAVVLVLADEQIVHPSFPPTTIPTLQPDGTIANVLPAPPNPMVRALEEEAYAKRGIRPPWAELPAIDVSTVERTDEQPK